MKTRKKSELNNNNTIRREKLKKKKYPIVYLSQANHYKK